MFKNSLTAFLFTITIYSNAQTFNIADIRDIVSDLTGITDSYFTPAAEGVAHQTSNGWFSTAKIEATPWRLTASLQGNMLFIPNKQRSFLIDENQFRNLEIVGSQTTAQAPTSIGNNNTVQLEGTIGTDMFDFETPEGINEEIFWHGQLQLGLTLPYKSEVLVRYAPRVSISDVNYQSYGLGIHHNLSQWIKAIDESSWNFSTLVFFSKFDIKTSFDDIDFILGNVNGVESDSNAFGLNFIGSKSYSNLTFTGALNFTVGDYKYSLGGNGDELLQILNIAIKDINTTDIFVTGNFTVRYDWDNFAAFSSLSVGQFQNLIVGLNYTFTNKRQNLDNVSQ